MARRGRYQSQEHPSERRYGSMGSIARELRWRRGSSRPGDLIRAFNLKYPNRPYSEKEGPNYEND